MFSSVADILNHYNKGEKEMSKTVVLPCKKCGSSMILFLGTKVCTVCDHEEEAGK